MVSMVDQRIKMCMGLSKTGLMRFISHLDLMRLIQRAFRRAGIPISLSKGFNPHPKLSIQPAIKLGTESRSLEASFSLDEYMEPSVLKQKLQEKLPDGIEILDIWNR